MDMKSFWGGLFVPKASDKPYKIRMQNGTILSYHGSKEEAIAFAKKISPDQPWKIIKS